MLRDEREIAFCALLAIALRVGDVETLLFFIQYKALPSEEVFWALPAERVGEVLPRLRREVGKAAGATLPSKGSDLHTEYVKTRLALLIFTKVQRLLRLQPMPAGGRSNGAHATSCAESPHRLDQQRPELSQQLLRPARWLHH